MRQFGSPIWEITLKNCENSQQIHLQSNETFGANNIFNNGFYLLVPENNKNIILYMGETELDDYFFLANQDCPTTSEIWKDRAFSAFKQYFLSTPLFPGVIQRIINMTEHQLLPIIHYKLHPQDWNNKNFRV